MLIHPHALDFADQAPSGMVIARLGDAAAARPTAARGFARHQAQIRHQLTAVIQMRLLQPPNSSSMSDMTTVHHRQEHSISQDRMDEVPLSDTSLGTKVGRLARLELDPALRERKTTTEYIVEALRAAIYDGQFADGEELNQVELANHFKASRVPVREALRQLQAEGLVNHVAHRRVVVVGLGLSEVVELIEMRAVMEGYLVEKTAPGLSKAQLHVLHRLCDEMGLIDDYGSDWVLKNREFHRALYLPSDSRAAIALVEQLHLKVERYIRRAGRLGRLCQAAKEHREILAAVERRDYAAARLRMQEHILHTADEIRHFEPDAEALARPREPKRSLRRSGSRI